MTGNASRLNQFLARALAFIVYAVALVSALPSAAQAKCAFVEVYKKRILFPLAAPGPPLSAKDVCFSKSMPCRKRYGCFKTWLDLGKKFVQRRPLKKRLRRRFGYIDPYGVHWDVPAGFVTDGATIPIWLKPLVGSSWNRYYVPAAVIHDFYIERAKRTIGHEPVHEVFFHALLAPFIHEAVVV